jgi:APA family basic amino acid/polyamine antiporter
MIAVPILRKREPDLPRPYKIPFYPLPPLLFLLGAATLFWGAFSSVAPTAWIAFGVLGLGVPVGAIFQRRRRAAAD